LPEVDARIGREIELVAGLDVPGRVPGVEIAYHAIDPEFRRAMRVREHSLAGCRLLRLVPPNLGVREEQTLITREAVENWRLLTFQGEVISRLGDGHACKIRDVLAERELSVHEHARNRAVGIVLLDQRARARIEILAIVGLPPVLKRARS